MNPDSIVRKKSSVSKKISEPQSDNKSILRQQADTLRKIKSLRSKTSVLQKEETSSDLYTNTTIHFKTNISSFKAAKTSNTSSVMVNKKKIKKIESNIRDLQNRNSRSIDRQKQLISQIDSYRRQLPFEFNSNYTKEIIKPNFHQKLDHSVTYCGDSRITPTMRERPSTAKLYNMQKRKEDNKSMTPLQEFLEMKKALSFQVDLNMSNSKQRSSSIEAKDSDFQSTKKQPHRYKSKAKFTPVPNIQMNSSLCMQEIVARLDDIQ